MRVTLPANPMSVLVKDSFAYVSCDGASLCIINIGNPDSAKIISIYGGYGEGQDAALYGNYLCLAEGTFGLSILDITNPYNPQQVGWHLTPGNELGVAMKGNYAYVADGTTGLRIIDISHPANPQEVGFCTTGGIAEAVTISGQYVYIANCDNGICIIDISQPTTPKKVGFYGTPDCALGITVVDKYIYVASKKAGVQIYEKLLLGVETKDEIINKETLETIIEGKESAGKILADEFLRHIHFVIQRGWQESSRFSTGQSRQGKPQPLD